MSKFLDDFNERKRMEYLEKQQQAFSASVKAPPPQPFKPYFEFVGEQGPNGEERTMLDYISYAYKQPQSGWNVIGGIKRTWDEDIAGEDGWFIDGVGTDAKRALPSLWKSMKSQWLGMAAGVPGQVAKYSGVLAEDADTPATSLRDAYIAVTRPMDFMLPGYNYALGKLTDKPMRAMDERIMRWASKDGIPGFEDFKYYAEEVEKHFIENAQFLQEWAAEVGLEQEVKELAFSDAPLSKIGAGIGSAVPSVGYAILLSIAFRGANVPAMQAASRTTALGLTGMGVAETTVGVSGSLSLLEGGSDYVSARTNEITPLTAHQAKALSDISQTFIFATELLPAFTWANDFMTPLQRVFLGQLHEGATEGWQTWAQNMTERHGYNTAKYVGDDVFDSILAGVMGAQVMGGGAAAAKIFPEGTKEQREALKKAKKAKSPRWQRKRTAELDSKLEAMLAATEEKIKTTQGEIISFSGAQTVEEGVNSPGITGTNQGMLLGNRLQYQQERAEAIKKAISSRKRKHVDGSPVLFEAIPDTLKEEGDVLASDYAAIEEGRPTSQDREQLDKAFDQNNMGMLIKLMDSFRGPLTPEKVAFEKALQYGLPESHKLVDKLTTTRDSRGKVMTVRQARATIALLDSMALENDIPGGIEEMLDKYLKVEVVEGQPSVSLDVDAPLAGQSIKFWQTQVDQWNELGGNLRRMLKEDMFSEQARRKLLDDAAVRANDHIYAELTRGLKANSETMADEVLDTLSKIKERYEGKRPDIIMAVTRMEAFIKNLDRQWKFSFAQRVGEDGLTNGQRKIARLTEQDKEVIRERKERAKLQKQRDNLNRQNKAKWEKGHQEYFEDIAELLLTEFGENRSIFRGIRDLLELDLEELGESAESISQSYFGLHYKGTPYVQNIEDAHDRAATAMHESIHAFMEEYNIDDDIVSMMEAGYIDPKMAAQVMQEIMRSEYYRTNFLQNQKLHGYIYQYIDVHLMNGGEQYTDEQWDKIEENAHDAVANMLEEFVAAIAENHVDLVKDRARHIERKELIDRARPLLERAYGPDMMHVLDTAFRDTMYHPKLVAENPMLRFAQHKLSPQSAVPASQGLIEFAQDGPAIMTLYVDHANFSTFHHEMAHFWLKHARPEVLAKYAKYMAKQLKEPGDETTIEELEKEAMMVLSKFVVGETLTSDELHQLHSMQEHFARNFEGYLFEGKGPTKRYRDLFGNFRLWMTDIYKSINKIPGVANEVHPELRKVFDSLLTKEDTAYTGIIQSRLGVKFQVEVREDQLKQKYPVIIMSGKQLKQHMSAKQLQEYEDLNQRGKLVEDDDKIEVKVMDLLNGKKSGPRNESTKFLGRGAQWLDPNDPYDYLAKLDTSQEYTVAELDQIHPDPTTVNEQLSQGEEGILKYKNPRAAKALNSIAEKVDLQARLPSTYTPSQRQEFQQKIQERSRIKALTETPTADPAQRLSATKIEALGWAYSKASHGLKWATREIFNWFATSQIEQLERVPGGGAVINDVTNRARHAVGRARSWHGVFQPNVKAVQTLTNGIKGKGKPNLKALRQPLKVVEVEIGDQKYQVYVSRFQAMVEPDAYGHLVDVGTLTAAEEALVREWGKLVDITGSVAETAGLKINIRRRKVQEDGTIATVTEQEDFISRRSLRASGEVGQSDDSRMARSLTDEGVRLLLDADETGRLVLAKALVALNPGITEAYAIEQLAMMSETRDHSFVNMEFARVFKVMPTHVEVPDVFGRPMRVQLMQTEPFKMAQSMASSLAKRLGFIEFFGQNRDAIQGEVDDVVKSVPPRSQKAAQARVNNLFRSLHGLPMYDGSRMTPGSGLWYAAQAFDTAIAAPLALWRGAILSWAWVQNMTEPWQKLPAYAGMGRTAKAWTKVATKIAGDISGSKFWGKHFDPLQIDNDYLLAFIGALDEEMYRMGAKNDMMMHAIINDSGQAHKAYQNVMQIAGSFLMNYTGVGYANNNNELWAALAAKDMVNALKNRQGTVADRGRLEMLGFTPDEIKSMMSGNAAETLYNDLVQRMPSLTQGTNLQPAEKSQFQRLSMLNQQIWPFMTYAIVSAATANRARLKIIQAEQQRVETEKGEQRRAAWTEATEDALGLWALAGGVLGLKKAGGPLDRNKRNQGQRELNKIGRKLIAGTLATSVIAKLFRDFLVKGPGFIRLRDWDEDDDGFPEQTLTYGAEALYEGIVSGGLAGMIYNYDSDNPDLANIAFGSVPAISVGTDLFNALAGTGRYKDKTQLDRAHQFLMHNTTGARNLTKVMGAWGLAGADDVELDNAIQKFYEIKSERQPFGTRGTTPEHMKTFRLHIRKGIEYLKEQPRTAFGKQIGEDERYALAMQEFAKAGLGLNPELDESTRSGIVKQSLLGYLTLARLSDEPQTKRGEHLPERVIYYQKLSNKQIEKLTTWDAVLTVMIENIE